MNKLLPIITLAALLTTSCFENTPSQQVLSAASCPVAAVSVFKVSFNESQGKYLIFHSAPTDGKALPNPLSVENLQMSQVQTPQGTNGESAKLNFSKSDGKCNPILEMTQGYKIELASANASSSSGGNNANASGSSGSYWAPFLMGALVGNAVSGAMQPRYGAPAYYLPPPSTGGQGGLVTGGVSGKTPDEMSKKYESQYKQPPKKGFFSKSTGATAQQDSSNQKKKSGFFSGGGDNSSKKSGGFFKKKKR
jgi:hypothetical protein